MKVFITGASGFIGKTLANYYRPWYIVQEFVRGQDIEQELKTFNPDVIITCAADIYNEENMWTSNVELVYKILEHARKTGVDRIIQLGSSSEYGRKTIPSAESLVLEPQTIYEATKAAATQLCLGYAHTYKIPVVVARPYSVFGPLEKPHRLFPRLVNAFLNSHPMILNQGYHDFIYIDDFVAGIDTLFCTNADIIRGDIVNFGSGIQTSNFQVLHIFQKICNIDGAVEIKESFAKSFESEVWVCDTQYAKTKYGFETKLSLEAGIEKLIEYHRRLPIER
jgi:nucleoside-diphosphate-sugar epimerase